MFLKDCALMTPSELKSEMRAQTLAKRDALPDDVRIEKSLLATEHGINCFEFDPGNVVSGFFPIRSEIDPRPWMDHIRRLGGRLCLPVVQDKETIIFRELLRTSELVDTGFGTRGPGEDAQVLDPEILIMPMSVFDLKGGRIGYGAGHYDRAIAKLIAKGLSPRLIGMAFDCQKAEQVPTEAHDQPLAAVLTESGYFEVSK